MWEKKVVLYEGLIKGQYINVFDLYVCLWFVIFIYLYKLGLVFISEILFILYDLSCN